MQNTKLNHPTEDELERYILNRSREEELEGVETHILACESCVTRLEDLELEISATKLALQDFRTEQLAKAEFPKESTWRAWFTVPKLSWTGAVATVALGLIVAPAFVPHQAPVAQVSLSAFRGEETFVVPAGHRLDMHLETADLAEGPVLVAIADIRGVEVWKGSTAIHHEQAEVVIPPITEKGAHFLRLYAAKQDGPDRDLLREFAFQVQ
jgi:anti-sigma factor RsiW